MTRPLILLLVFAAVVGAGCFSFDEVKVVNRSSQTVLVSNITSCDQAVRTQTFTQALAPGGEYTTFSFSGFGAKLDCLIVQDIRGVVLIQGSVEGGGLFEIRGSANRVSLERVGDANSWSLNPGWLLLLYLIPFVIGMPFALFFAGQFFYRFYVSKSIPGTRV